MSEARGTFAPLPARDLSRCDWFRLATPGEVYDSRDERRYQVKRRDATRRVVLAAIYEPPFDEMWNKAASAEVEIDFKTCVVPLDRPERFCLGRCRKCDRCYYWNPTRRPKLRVYEAHCPNCGESLHQTTYLLRKLFRREDPITFAEAGKFRRSA